LFDRILVDVPCSGERHILEDLGELAEWTPKRSKNLAERQARILTNALISLKPGGLLVYSTCSISLLENDNVIKTTLAKLRSVKAEIVELHDLPIGRATSIGGWQILPHLDSNWGPIYFCALRKLII
jgi:16S rRNA C967 or C1407 C5-methylase (RsmB/RsmF family)